MNTHSESSWPREGSVDQLVSQDLDFSSILMDGDGLNFQLPDLETNDAGNQFAVQHPNTPFNSDMSGMQPGTAAHDFAPPNWDMSMDMDTGEVLASHANSQENLQFQSQMGQQLWETTSQSHNREGQMGNIVYRQPQQIPPTPNSYELHGGDAAQYAQQMAQGRAFVEQQIQQHMQIGRAKRNDFTPLVSPAVTPQDPIFQHHIDFGTAAYFSPLTSPALQAQQQFRSANAHGTQPSTARTSAATSPITNDPDIDMFTASGGQAAERPRKTTKKASSRSIGSRPAARSSPVTKPQKRKSAALSAAISNGEIDTFLQDPQVQQLNNSARASASTDGSGPGSISPEPLSEALMGPPPRPGAASNMQSPILFAQSHHGPSRLKDSAAPATPASLMAIDNPRNANGKTPLTGSGKMIEMANLDAANLDDFALPPSVTNNTVLESANSTPRITPARKTPKLGPLSSAGGRISATSSPAISAIPSPSGATTPQFPKDARNRNNNKKRGSVSGGSQLISPALRPKISPSIKPLLPDSATNEQTQAYLLASKSNYTHLLEGTLLPGVSYPESLSSGLTSKRTSHKIAEQGRRNRINEALKEMQTLLPPPAIRKSASSEKDTASPEDNSHDDKADDEDSPNYKDEKTSTSGTVTAKDKDKDIKAGKSSKASPSAASAKAAASASTAAAEAKAANSKAATVESAIVYIKTLQQERASMEEKMIEKDREVNELRKRLREVEFKLDSPDIRGEEMEVVSAEGGGKVDPAGTKVNGNKVS